MIEFSKIVRQVFEKNKDVIDLPFMCRFPRNCCEASATYLAFLAMDKFPQAAVMVVHGRSSKDEHHYWVEYNGEDRFLLLGISFKLNTVVVSHCYREDEKIVRIISARKADKGESAPYWSERK